MPFSQKTIDFIFENRLNDSKVWFNEHKEDYKKFVVEPFHELVEALTPTMLGIDSELVCDPKRLSRIYRDARFTKGKSIFRENVWYSFCRRKEFMQPVPEIFIDASPAGFSYGCGYYQAGRDTMDAMREMIINDDKAFKAALKAYEAQNVFVLEGDLYKKNHYPDESEKKCNWLNRKCIYFICQCKDKSEFFSDKLAEKLAEDFKSIAPIYQFMIKAEDVARTKQT